MRRVLNGLRNAAFFLLCYAQVPMLAGHFLLSDPLPLLLVQMALLPVSFLISLVPGHVGGGAKKEKHEAVRQVRRGNDPDPDKGLRNEALPEEQRRAFPLRALVCLIGMIGILTGVFFLPVEAVAEMPLWNRIVMSVLMAAMLPLAVKVIALNSSNTVSVTVGMLLYIFAGATAYYTKDAALEKLLLLCGTAFLVLTGFVVNNLSMAKGASVREGVRPPAGMRRKNRVLLVLFGAVAVVVVYFDVIRQKTIDAVSWIGVKLWRFLLWITNLLYGGDASVSGGGGGGGGMDMSAFGPAESGAFWEHAELLLYILAIIAGGAVVFWFLVQVYRLVRNLIRKLIAHLKKFAESVGEEYQDEQESLFDWGETKKELGDNLRKRLQKLTAREKKWDQMDARERVRFIVRSLYRKSADSGNLSSLTVHEALKTVGTGEANPEELAGLYDTARYSQKEPDPGMAERIRKEAKV